MIKKKHIQDIIWSLLYIDMKYIFYKYVIYIFIKIQN